MAAKFGLFVEEDHIKLPKIYWLPKRDFMLFLSDNNQTDIIEAFNSISRYLVDLILTILILNKW